MTRSAFRTLFAATALAGGLTVASAASAATTVTLHETLDLFKATISSTQPQVQAIFVGFTPVVSFDLGVGDTLDFTLAFAGTEHLQATNLSNIQSQFFSNQDNQLVSMTGFLELRDQSGSAIFPGVLPSAAAPFSDVQGNVVGQAFTTPPSFFANVDLYSLHYHGVVDAYNAFGGSPKDLGTRHYDNGIFEAGSSSGGKFKVLGAAPVVPEPSTWAMFLTGFLGLGAMLRRRRALATA